MLIVSWFYFKCLQFILTWCSELELYFVDDVKSMDALGHIFINQAVDPDDIWIHIRYLILGTPQVAPKRTDGYQKICQFLIS